MLEENEAWEMSKFDLHILQINEHSILLVIGISQIISFSV